MTTLVDRFKDAYGKSQGVPAYDGPLRLHDHVMDVTRVVTHVLDRSAPQGYGQRRADALVLAAYLHDIGKLDPNFKEMLWRVHHKQSLEGLPRVKHEASTFDFVSQVTPDDLCAVAAAIAEKTGHRVALAHLEDSAVLEDVWAHAVTHHGLFYVSSEEHGGQVRPCIRRQWTAYYPRERGRLTLADLLFEYHPLGGLVIVGDIVASAWHGWGQPIESAFSEANTFQDFLAVVRREEVLHSAAAQQRRDEGRDGHLAAMARLLLGGTD